MNTEESIFNDIKDIKRVSVSNELFEFFKKSIISGKLKPGSNLPTEKELCGITGVGRGTVREVLSALVYMKLIVRSKRGTFVNKNPNLFNVLPFPSVLKRVHYKDIINLRIILETGLIEAAVQNAVDEDIKELEDSIEKMKNSTSIDSLMKIDTKFHISLATASHNELFNNILSMIREELSSLIYEVFSKDDSIRERACGHHERITNAIKNRNMKEAKEAMRVHILDVNQTMEKLDLLL